MGAMKRVAAGVAALMGGGALTAVLVFATAVPASAHQVLPIGKYQFTVGWENEPTYSGFPNAVYLGVKTLATMQPLDDIGSVKVTVSTGTLTSAPLVPELTWDPDTGLGQHGVYYATIIPTTPGVYTFHFTGSIAGQTINQSFKSSDATFNDVVDPTAVQFPVKVPTATELGTNAARVTARVGDAASKASSASDSASSAKTLGIVALIVAIVLGGAAIGIAADGAASNGEVT